MTARIARDPSPVRSALLHGSLGFVTLVGTLGIGGAAIHFMGDADASSPAMRVALFDQNEPGSVDLNPRLASLDEAAPVFGAQTSMQPAANGDQPDLGVEYGGASRDGGAPVVRASTDGTGIRINGKTVLPGQSLSQVQDGAAQPVLQTASAREVPAAKPAAPKTTMHRYARDFVNPENKPTVSIIVGGLGINRGRTNAAISELPADVTLSFSPTTVNLQSWVSKARRAGHEVLIELPMEPYDYGRERPHPQVLQVAAGTETNTRRLLTMLSRVNGYAGVMNYQGGKFATSADAAGPVFDILEQKGLSFFEDGSLSRSVFSEAADQEGVRFGKAGAWIDARPEADEITNQLMRLEVQATESGSALGVGMSYPITIDILKDWTERLEAKGFVLAPASHYAKASDASGQIKVAALDTQG